MLDCELRNLEILECELWNLEILERELWIQNKEPADLCSLWRSWTVTDAPQAVKRLSQNALKPRTQEDTICSI